MSSNDKQKSPEVATTTPKPIQLSQGDIAEFVGQVVQSAISQTLPAAVAAIYQAMNQQSRDVAAARLAAQERVVGKCQECGQASVNGKFACGTEFTPWELLPEATRPTTLAEYEKQKERYREDFRIPHHRWVMVGPKNRLWWKHWPGLWINGVKYCSPNMRVKMLVPFAADVEGMISIFEDNEEAQREGRGNADNLHEVARISMKNGQGSVNPSFGAWR